MARKLTTEDQLTRLRQLRGGESSPQAIDSLREVLAGARTHGIVVKGAAQLALKWEAKGLADALRAAAEGLVPPEGAKRDPGCEGKEAVLRALVQWEVEVPDFFVAAARWVQMQPVMKGSIDTAAECRGLAALGVAQTRPKGAISLLIELLVDKETPTRLRTAQALGMWRGPESGPLLRLKALMGDENADVLGEVFVSLLRGDDRAGTELHFVKRFLHDEDMRVVEAAAVALGESRQPAALAPLIAAWQRLARDPVRTSLLMAIALLRQEESLEWLLSQLKKARPSLALEILHAMAIYRGDDRAVGRIQQAAEYLPEAAEEFKALFETK